MTAEDQVREFMLKNRWPLNQQLPLSTSTPIARAALDLEDHAKRMLAFAKMYDDPRYMRAHLLLEELGETLRAMSTGDKLKMYDGLLDLAYVAVGTCVKFGLPFTEGFDEVHRSNMSKTSGMDADNRGNGKGPNYTPPNLERILK